jgi:hypothetical protein
MKTYAETKGKPVFDWRSFLANPPVWMDTERWEAASALAAKWPTCACGEQDSRIPRSRDGSPKDTILEQLGQKFNQAIWQRNTRFAEITLEQIESRVAELLLTI